MGHNAALESLCGVTDRNRNPGSQPVGDLVVGDHLLGHLRERDGRNHRKRRHQNSANHRIHRGPPGPGRRGRRSIAQTSRPRSVPARARSVDVVHSGRNHRADARVPHMSHPQARRTWSAVIAITVLVLAAEAALMAAGCARAPPLPQARVAPLAADTTLALAGLAAPARIVTDVHGIVHVRAENLTDLYRVWGFVTARDRLWQMVYTRQSARGDLWGWFGNPALRADGGAQLFELADRVDRIWAR